MKARNDMGGSKPKLFGGVYKKYFKRLIDFFLSLLLVVSLSPMLIVIAILVKAKLGSPVIFKQKRPGLGERIFTMYKFRTMTDEKGESGALLSDEYRLTRFGKFLRSTSLDELPELFNIIKGDMSFVGPRPLLEKYLPYFKDAERVRSNVRPGVTGLAQISGRNSLGWDARFAADIEYVNTLSLFTDIKVIIRTVVVVFQRRNILVGSEHVLKDLDVERREEVAK